MKDEPKRFLLKIELLPMWCKTCGKKFLTKRPTQQKYCSGPCGSRGWRIQKRYEKWLEARKRENALVENALKEEAQIHLASQER